MPNDVKISIKAENKTKAGVDSAKREMHQLRVPLERTRSAAEALSRIIHGDIGDGIAQLGQAFVGTFGKLAAMIGAVGVALGVGWKLGTWIRDVTGLGKALDKLIVPAKAANKSINGLVNANVAGMADGLKAARDRLGEIKQEADSAGAALASLNQKQQAIIETQTEQDVSNLKAREPESAKRNAQESAIRASGAERAALNQRKLAVKQLELERKAQQAIADEIAKSQKAMEAYKATLADSTVKERALAGGASGTEGFDAWTKELVKVKTAQEQIAQTQAHIAKLTKEAAKQAVEVIKAETEVEKAGSEVVKTKRATLDAQVEIANAIQKEDEDKEKERLRLAKERADVENDIADDLAQVERENIAKKWADELERAQTAAEKIAEALGRREDMGKVGSREWKNAMTAERKRKREERRLVEQQAALGIKGTLSQEQLAGMSDQQIQQGQREARILKRLGLRAGKDFGSDSGLSADKAAALAAKRGIKLSREDMDTLRRSETLRLAEKAKADAQVAKANVEGAQKDAENEARKALLAEVKSMNEKLVTLLQAAG